MQQSRQRPQWKRGHFIALAVIGGLFVLVAFIAVAAALPGGVSEPAEAPSANEAALAALEAIDPALVVGASVGNDIDGVCLDIEQGKDDATLARNASLRFDVDETVGAEIVEAVRPHC